MTRVARDLPAVIVGAMLLSGLTGRAHAQQGPEHPPWTQTREQLEAAGWEHGEEGGQAGSVWGGVLALTVGTVAHGVGHLYAGDERTGKQLLITEGVGLGMIGLGVLLETLTDSEGSLAPINRTFTALGASLFVTTWLLDVIGTFKGTGSHLPPHGLRVPELRVDTAYTHLFEQGLPLIDAGTIEVGVDFGPFFVVPRGVFGLDLEYLAFGTDLGIRFGLGTRTMSFIDLTLKADEVIAREAGFGYEAISASIGLSVDLGDALPHLDGIVYSNRLGVGAQFFRYDFNNDRVLNGDNVSPMLLVEAGLSAHIVPRLVIETGYLQRPDLAVGNLTQSVGAFFATLSYSLTTAFDLYVDGRFGQGVQLFTGTRFHFWPWAQRAE